MWILYFRNIYKRLVFSTKAPVSQRDQSVKHNIPCLIEKKTGTRDGVVKKNLMGKAEKSFSLHLFMM